MDRAYWALFDSVIGYINPDGVSDWTDPADATIAGDSLAPEAPTVSVASKPNAIELTLTPPTLNADGTPCVDFKEYVVYFSGAGAIDITDPATYTSVYTVSGSKTEKTHHTHPTTTTTYFIVTANDTSGNASEGAGETSATPDAAETVTTNYVPNPFFAIDTDGDGIPDDWTLQAGWERVAEAFQGSYSLRGQGSGVSAISDKVTLPSSNKGLTVSGVAKTSGTSFSLNEIADVATTSAPIAYTDASGDLAAVARQNASYDIIELWDISDPAAPYKIGSIDSSGDSEHRSKPFQIYGDYLICGNQTSNHLYIYSISDPSAPTLVKDYTLANAPGRLAALAIRDWYVFACCNDNTNGGFIETINIMTPASATQTDIKLADIDEYDVYLDAQARNGELIVTVEDDSFQVTATGTVDASSQWTDDDKAIDGNDDTYAYDNVGTGDWSALLGLTIASHRCTGVRFKVHTPWTPDLGDVYVYDGASGTHVLSAGAVTDYDYTTVRFTAQTVDSATIQLKNNWTGPDQCLVYEFQFLHGNSVRLYDISDLTAIALQDSYALSGAKRVRLNGAFAYVVCDSGTDANKIVVLNITDPANISYETAVGGAGADNYTGSDALFMSNGYLVNVGEGSDAAKYSVSYWDISSPDLPVLESVKYDFVGDLDAADDTGGFIVGVDVDNSKVKVVDPQIAADWEFRVKFYDISESLIESITVYDGDYDIPYTGESWTVFSQVIPEADIPNATKKVEFVCYCNESTGYVYVDSLEAKFE